MELAGLQQPAILPPMRRRAQHWGFRAADLLLIDKVSRDSH